MATNNSVNVGLSGSTGTGNFVGATSPTLVTPILGTPQSGNLANCTGPTGSMFNFKSFTLTTNVGTAVNNSFVTISGFSVTITPTSSSNKILVRLSLNHCATLVNVYGFQLLRGATPIATNTAASGNTAGSTGFLGSIYGNSSTIEFLDTPATTSATTYNLQAWSAQNITVYLNFAYDSGVPGSQFMDGISTFTACEIQS